jgi:hypothetical protein
VDPSVAIGLWVLAAVVVAAAAGWSGLRLVRGRYRHLLAAIEGTGRQLTELRRSVDRLQERVQTVDDRIGGIEPLVARLGRNLEIERASERVRAAELTGRLTRDSARELLRHLADLGDADSPAAPAGGAPHGPASPGGPTGAGC